MKPRHSSNESDEILSDIAQTRAQMDQTLDELGERLQPRHIIDDVLDYFRSRRRSGSHNGSHRMRRAAGKAAGQVKQKAGDAGRVAYDQVRQHPLPALLIGAGISLLFMQRNRQDDYEMYEGEDQMLDDTGATYAEIEASGASPESFALPQHYTGDTGSSSPGMMSKLKGKGSELKQKAGSSIQHMKERTAETAGALRRRASETGTHLKERAYETGSHLKDKAYHGYEHGREVFTRTADEQPLAVGLGFLAIGVLAGMLLPSTRKEDELVGPTRDRLVNRGREAAEDAVNRGKHVARTAMDVAKQQAQEQGLTPEALKEKAQSMASQVKDATREDAQRQKQEFTEHAKHS